jgi:hypothetical protein
MKTTIRRKASDKMKLFFTSPSGPPSRKSQQTAWVIYQQLEQLDDKSRYAVVDTPHFLAHAEIDCRRGKLP